ncbi:MAG: hypothetical protein WD490_02470 [Opitutales bacterium]
MMDSNLYIADAAYRELVAHLFEGDDEQVAFLFAEYNENGPDHGFHFRQAYLVPPSAFDFQSSYHIALADEAWAQIIKTAWDTGTCPIEVHSHRGTEFPPAFSGSDFFGFKKTVPHVRWRLRGRPYAALVFTPDGYDGLVWKGADNEATAVGSIVLDDQILRPSGLSINYLTDDYEHREI